MATPLCAPLRYVGIQNIFLLRGGGGEQPTKVKLSASVLSKRPRAKAPQSSDRSITVRAPQDNDAACADYDEDDFEANDGEGGMLPPELARYIHHASVISGT